MAELELFVVKCIVEYLTNAVEPLPARAMRYARAMDPLDFAILLRGVLVPEVFFVTVTTYIDLGGRNKEECDLNGLENHNDEEHGTLDGSWSRAQDDAGKQGYMRIFTMARFLVERRYQHRF